ncbi:response regulator [Methylosinus sp. H3A]|uniref:response regulator n=1 Tax=Methylosinus sp. H3A TaxID=2785786 RepID=UPI0018C2CE61|nr:response regulator [Methylosinus sp. H3A]MBG0810118.1 response regulator [Methylosinus sp. H3A]
MRSKFIDTSLLLYAGFAVLAASLFAAFAFVGKQATDYRDVRQLIGERQVQHHILDRLQEAESAQRGYLLTNDRAYLAPLDAATARIRADFDALSGTAESVEGRDALETLRALATDKLAELRKTVELQAAGKHDEAVTIVREGAGKEIMERLRAGLDAKAGRQQQMIDAQSRLVEKNSSLLRVGAALAISITILIGAATIGLLRSRLREIASAQSELRDVNAALSTEAAQREHLAEQLRQSQKMEAIGQLTGGLAHDFNNMLAVVIGSVNLAKRRLSTDPAETLRYLDGALEGAEHAATLTHRLLAFSRRQPLAPEPIDPNKMVSGMAEMLRRTLGEDMNLEAVFAGGLWRAFADTSQLETTILNLALNARDAMTQGGKLTIETSNAYLDEEYAAREVGIPPGQYVLIAVTDTGTGMSRETVERAFDPFFTTKPSGRGTGLGLSQVYGFVRQSGGHVRIYSELGLGTTIKLYLPRHHGSASATATATHTRAAPRSEKSETILIVEDDVRVRDLTADTLAELGYNVLAAESAAAALRQLEVNPHISLLFTDVVMPDTNGRKLAEEAWRRRPDLKILFTTGYTPNAVVHNGVLDPGVELIVKPYSIDRLARKVRDVLDGPRSAPPETKPTRRKVLIVDDDAAVCEAMAELLRLENYEVCVASDGFRALEAAQSFKPDVALLDLGLPGMDGYEIARELRALPEGRDILLLASTGAGGDTVRRLCEAAGFDRHLVKPIDLDALKALIDGQKPHPTRSA